MAGSAMAQSVGNAIIENMCKYDVQLTAVPAQNGGYETSQHRRQLVYPVEGAVHWCWLVPQALQGPGPRPHPPVRVHLPGPRPHPPVR